MTEENDQVVLDEEHKDGDDAYSLQPKNVAAILYAVDIGDRNGSSS